MLNIHCLEHLNEVKTFADKTGQQKQLNNQIQYLSTYADPEENGATQCHLFYDSAPQSFHFRMDKKSQNGEYVYWFSGGLIYHGTHDRGGDGGAPTYSVTMSPTQGWSVHT